MPRKQRFKPSRKQPSSQQQQAQVEKQQELHPRETDVEHDMPARGRPDDSDVESSR